MYNYTVSLIFGLVAMSFVVVSYFLKKKTQYLIFQATAIMLLALSYLFIEEFFAMVAYGVSMIRVIVYFLFERKNKPVSIYIKSFFALLVVLVFVIVNIVILNKFKYIDILCVVSNIIYSYVFGIRNMKIMRYTILVPNSLSLLYNIFVGATPFVIVSYSFEVLANIISIFKFYIIPYIKGRKNSEEINSKGN